MRIVTGNPQADRMTVEQHRQAAAAQGLAFHAEPLAGGGFLVRAYPGGAGSYAAPPQGYAPQQQGYAPQQHAYAPAPAGGAPFGGVVVGGPQVAGARPAALTPERVKYIRKVYGLLFASVLIAVVAGLAVLTLGPEERIRVDGKTFMLPVLVGIMLSNRIVMWGAFGLLFVATLAAGAVSKVRGLNIVALFGVSALMGIEAAPMIYVAQVLAGLGRTMSVSPVLDSFLLVLAVFGGATGYVAITRKDFSYLSATLSMGFMVVFVGCLLAAVFQSEIFSLAIATVGALVAAGLLLVQTSSIFRKSAMDDAVGDALGLLVQLRNLFLFILRILMSSRR